MEYARFAGGGLEKEDILERENGQELHVGGVGKNELDAGIGVDLVVMDAIRRAEKPQPSLVICLLIAHRADMERDIRKFRGEHAGGGFPDQLLELGYGFFRDEVFVF